MNDPLRTVLEGLTFGTTQRHRNLAVTPLYCESAPKVQYTTLAKALQTGHLTISEVSEGGSVPELKLVSDLEEAVLLLDGEELRGAKQNRVLNATILVDARSRIVIPVSCTEQGRWSYQSDRFGDSNVVMTASHRAAKVNDVRESLERDRSYRSDQSAVWARVGEMQAQLGVQSQTGAMRDTYAQMRDRLADYAEAFPCQSDQRGLAVSVNGRLVGFDLVSRPDAYAELHQKLIQSYAMDGVLGSAAGDASSSGSVDVRAFIEQLYGTRETEHPSVGLGLDFRYDGLEKAGTTIVGSALVVDDEPVHVAFFRLRRNGTDAPGRMAGYDRRSRFRSGRP